MSIKGETGAWVIRAVYLDVGPAGEEEHAALQPPGFRSPHERCVRLADLEPAA